MYNKNCNVYTIGLMNNLVSSASNDLNIILDQYTEWYNDVVLQLFYPSEKNDGMAEAPNLPVNVLLTQGSLEKNIFQKIQPLKTDLLKLSNDLIMKAKLEQKPPSFKDFENFSNIYEEFSNQLRRLQIDNLMDDSGIDVLTGLRSKNAMTKDIQRELERLARRGKPFCLALAQIDYFPNIQKSYNSKDCDKFIISVSDMIKKSIRSFDDAYRLSSGEFILCLKQADLLGGLVALDRLRLLLEHEKIMITVDGRSQLLTMSCCIAEPVDIDIPEDIIANLRKDLRVADKSPGLVLEYIEMSPLQRFVKTE